MLFAAGLELAIVGETLNMSEAQDLGEGKGGKVCSVSSVDENMD